MEPEQAIINDVNSRLITFYKCVRDHYEEMRSELDLIQEVYERNQADYKVRKALAPDERAAFTEWLIREVIDSASNEHQVRLLGSL